MSIIGQVTIHGDKKLLNTLRRVGDARNGARQAITEATGILLREAKELCRHDTGALRRSIHSEFEQGGMASTTGTNLVYAAIHEFGGVTKPHTIIPKRKKALRFESGGKTIFAKKVNHPGSRITAQPYLRPALMAARPELLSRMKKYVRGA